MRVKIEQPTILKDYFQVRILTGYRTGELLRRSDTEHPMFDVDRGRLVKWLQDTGYEVVNPESNC